jgi:endonuclease YncB( thermonuclease family)
MKKNLFIAVLMLLCSLALSVDAWNGKVVAVLDGDTIEVLQDGRAVRIRLAGIDCPERRQDYGEKAKRFASEMVFGRVVEVQNKGMDRYGRLLAEVTIDGKSLNQELVRNGLAWWYHKYSPNDTVLAALEGYARSEGANIWSRSDAVPPWEFRLAASRSSVSEDERQRGQAVFHGNVKSRVFHRPGCQHYNCKNCIANFSSTDEAIRAGYRPCRICNP